MSAIHSIARVKVALVVLVVLVVLVALAALLTACAVVTADAATTESSSARSVAPAPQEQTYPPPVTVYNVGSLIILRVRDEAKKADCYVLQQLGAGSSQAALSCLRDPSSGAGSTQALKGWVYFP